MTRVFQRREFLVAGACGLGSVVCSCASPPSSPQRTLDGASYSQFRSLEGCRIAPEQFARLTFGNLPPNPQPQSTRFDIRASPLLNQSGEGRGFDEALGDELVAMSREFDEIPGFGFYDDRAGNNALASHFTRVEGTSGTIAFGSGLLHRLLARSGGDIAILAVCAHEFGHIHQFGSDVERELRRDELPGFATELHADFLAGWYLSRFVARRPSVSLQTVGEHWDSAEMGSTDFSNPGTHGTSRQRINAIEAGFYFEQESGLGVAEASDEGIRYLQRELA